MTRLSRERQRQLERERSGHHNSNPGHCDLCQAPIEFGLWKDLPRFLSRRRARATCPGCGAELYLEWEAYR